MTIVAGNGDDTSKGSGSPYARAWLDVGLVSHDEGNPKQKRKQTVSSRFPWIRVELEGLLYLSRPTVLDLRETQSMVLKFPSKLPGVLFTSGNA